MAHTAHVIWRKINNALVVVVITLLIWFAADQNVFIEQEFSIPVRLTSEEADRYAGFAEPPYQKRLTVKMRGRRRRLREFADLLEGRRVFDVNIGPSKPTDPQPQSISTLDDIILKMEDYRKSKLSVVSVQPEMLRARIDRIVSIDGVRVAPDAGDLKVSVEVSPKTVSVSLPEFVRRRLGDAPIATAFAEQSILTEKKPDGTFQVTVPVAFAGLDKLDPLIQPRFHPAEVTLSGRVEALTATERKGPIQVKWYVPDDVQRDYVIVKEQGSLRLSIDVTGPKHRVEQLDPADIMGMVEVFAADRPDVSPVAEIVRNIEFILPPDFADCSPAPDARTFEVRFRLEPRAANLGTAKPG